MRKYENVNINKLIPYANNARVHSDEQIKKIQSSIREFGFVNPVLIDSNFSIIAGHGRAEAAKREGIQEVPCLFIEDLTEAQKKAYILADNRMGLDAGWDTDMLKVEMEALKEMDFDISLTGFDEEELKDMFREERETETVEDDFEIEEPIEPISKLGDIYKLGEHRLMCGDSTNVKDIEKLMDGRKANLGHNDPPYGMKKENEGVLNDNLNYDDLLMFNKKWIENQFKYLEDNGSFYCWGTDEPLMDIYSEILKPMIKAQKATFRNLITWNKGNGQGQNAEDFRSYAIADEKCLFVMCGVQGFNTNVDNYFEGWEPIRDYLLKSRIEMGWDVATMKKIVGHSETSRDHWTSKSQFNMPTKEVYNKMKAEADRLRGETNNDAFKKEYDELKKEYDELKKEYYSTRSYFDNTHDNMNNVWNIKRTSQQERENTGGHATPKPIELCSRVIKSSSREKDIVLDVFGGSGSTLIACEQLKRKCYMMELDPKYVDVIINRWETFTGKTAILLNGGE